MIALDTNVLVRFLVEDDPEQTERARAVLQKAVAADEPCFVPEIVLCELVWVLERSYRLKQPDIARVLARLLPARHLAFAAVDKVARALEAYGNGRAGFADYLIREDARENGCSAVATFDKDLLKESGFLSP